MFFWAGTHVVVPYVVTHWEITMLSVFQFSMMQKKIAILTVLTFIALC